MNISMMLAFVSLVFAITIFASFILKAKDKTAESSFFFFMIVTDIVGLCLEALSLYAILFVEVNPELTNIICRLYAMAIVLALLSISLFTCVLYNDELANKSSGRRFRIFMVFIFTIEVLCTFFGSYDIVNTFSESSKYYSYMVGFVPNSIAIYGVILFFLNSYYVFNHRNFYLRQRLLCLFFYTVVLIISGSMRIINPGLNFIFTDFTIIIVLVYFLIENYGVKKVTKLREMRLNLNEANETKNKFLSNMSHDIRTYLNTLIVSSNLLLSKNVDDEISEDLKNIVFASDSLLEIVGNILDLNKIEDDEIERIDVPYDLKSEAKSIAEMNMVRIENKPIKFVMNIDPSIPDTLMGDKVHVKQVLNNLLSNAFKYTREGSVSFKINCVNDYAKGISNLIIEVQDTGIGIKDTSRLFNKFDRMDMDKTSKIEGTGLGLVITKRMIDLMGGDLEVESEYGKGSLFRLTLAQVISEEQVDQSYASNNLENDLRGKKILLVDNDKQNLRVLSKLFADFDCFVDTCLDSRKSLNMIPDKKYDVVLTDIVMDDVDGYAILKQAKRYNIPVIAVTADALQDSEEKYRKEGFSGYVSKPFSRTDIYKEIVKVMKKE